MKHNPCYQNGTKLNSNVITNFHDYEKGPNESKCIFFNLDKIIGIFVFGNEIQSHYCYTKPRSEVKMEGIVIEQVKNSDKTGNSNSNVEEMKNYTQTIDDVAKAMVLKNDCKLRVGDFYSLVKNIG